MKIYIIRNEFNELISLAKTIFAKTRVLVFWHKGSYFLHLFGGRVQGELFFLEDIIF